MTNQATGHQTASAGRPAGFLDRVRAEQLPTRFRWQARDWVALLAVPSIFVSGWLTTMITNDVAVGTVVDTVLRIALFVVLVVANRALLARHWRAFWAAPWLSVGLVVVGMVALQIAISSSGSALRSLGGLDPGDDQGPVPSMAFGVLLFTSLNPMVTALIEDFTFRHTLLLKFPVWNRFVFAAVLTVANAVLFGAVHIDNFGGEWLLTLSFAAAGLVMNLTYLWTRNIWHVLLMHGVNNFILAGPVGVVILHVLQAAVV
ncbi:CPBP family intramembrane glutamic endopeptidase [Frigoribacterium sp. VKM Ac-2836]|uniref:CPBP family intramembrane glutamic endopeptidase n=1 Tax=Frigoribacterium sp. VKM Ac-2836 TaxID=2739014 RepID=UPI001564B709|nr:CPBP family intramembrane glutamic endopeptidase [Frigoribacterium sp. VKM Ac-2836]NRD26941.1 CPBP family intramembrane metalloprotease [Frigoribacterium sp. VKM Ac-2836]